MMTPITRAHGLTISLLSSLALVACSGDDSASGTDTATGTATAATITATGVTTATTGSSMSGTASESDTDTGTGSASATTSTTDPTDSTSSGETATTTGPGTTTAVTTTDTDTDTSTTGMDCVLTCSDDLKQVLCDGVPIQDCNDGDQFCGGGECIDSPCEAAKKEQRSEGCEFWSVKTGLISEASGTCFATFVANTGKDPVHIEVEYQGQSLPVQDFARIPSGQGNNIVYGPYDQNLGLPAGEVAILFLSRGPGSFPECPGGIAAIKQETQVTNTGRGQAFHITSDYPVAAYQMLPYGGGSVAATSATLLLPSGTWDVNYVAIDAYTKSQAAAEAQPLITLVGNEDNTKITINPKVAIIGGNGVDPAPANVPHDYFLNRGETLQIAQPAELTGSAILGDKAFLLFGGATCLNVPVNAYACDGAHQQIPPVKALGSAYTAIRYRNRTNQEESPPWRLVGAVDGTTLTWINKPPGSPDTLAFGQVAEFNSSGPFAVSSQDGDHPFYLAAYMTGGDNYSGIGDPEWVNVIPSAQYLKRYVLFTDPTYPETSLVVVRTPVDNAFADVTLGCNGPLTGWMPIGDKEYTRIDLVTGNFQDVGNCSNGRHEMYSDNPFGVTVWGWGSAASQGFFSQYVSYAYPAGASVKAINDVEILPQ